MEKKSKVKKNSVIGFFFENWEKRTEKNITKREEKKFKTVGYS